MRGEEVRLDGAADLRYGWRMGAAPEIPSLTALRFVAATTVVLSHFGQASHASLFGFEFNIAFGMPLFFILSGFVVHYVYAGSFARHWRAAVPRFAIARFSRLYPLFLALLTYYLLAPPLRKIFLTHWDIGISYVMLAGTWWYWVVDGTTISTNLYGISWSIATEVFFYLVYALGLYRIARIDSVRQCLKAAAALCVGAYILLYVVWVTTNIWEPFVLARYPHFVAQSVDNNNSFYRWLLYISPYFHLLEFIAGCLTCQLFLLMSRGGAAWRRTAEALAWLGIAWIGIAQALLYATWYFGYRGEFFNFVNFLHMTFLMAPGCCFLILALALGGSSVGRALGLRVPVYLGEISYSIYLTHVFIYGWVVVFGWGEPVYAMTVGLLAVVAGSSLTYFAIERPAKAWLRAGFAPAQRRARAIISGPEPGLADVPR